MIGFTMIVETPDASKFVETFRRMYKNLWAISDDEDFETIKKTVSHKPDAETIDGRKVDTVTFDPSQLGDAAPPEADLKGMQKVLGNQIVLRFGAVDDKRVVVAFGGGEARFKTIMASVKGGASLSTDAGIGNVQGNLPSPRGTEWFVAVDTFIQTFKRINVASGQDDDINFDIPKLQAPVAMSTALQGKIGRYDLFVPMKLISTMSEAVQKQQTAANDFDEEDGADGAGKGKEEGGE
jgi:hypothetical protein